MTTKNHPIPLTEYEYGVLESNSLISVCCASQLKSATKTDEGVELSITLAELTELIGFVAAEANHARSSRKSEDLNSICDWLEGLESELKS